MIITPCEFHNNKVLETMVWAYRERTYRICDECVLIDEED